MLELSWLAVQLLPTDTGSHIISTRIMSTSVLWPASFKQHVKLRNVFPHLFIIKSFHSLHCWTQRYNITDQYILKTYVLLNLSICRTTVGQYTAELVVGTNSFFKSHSLICPLEVVSICLHQEVFWYAKLTEKALVLQFHKWKYPHWLWTLLDLQQSFACFWSPLHNFEVLTLLLA